jgi:hypothetical protein
LKVAAVGNGYAQVIQMAVAFVDEPIIVQSSNFHFQRI